MIIDNSKAALSKKNQLLNDPQKHQKIMKIIIQTLYNLGYEKSANELEHQSDIFYMKPEIKFMKTALPQQKYEELENYLKDHKIEVPTSIRNIIMELKCMQCIEKGQIEKVLSMIQSYDEQQVTNEQNYQQDSEALDKILYKKSGHAENEKTFDREKKYLNWQKIKEKLAEQIMIGDGKIPQEQLQEMHEFIIEKSLQSDIEPKSMDKIMSKFLQLQKMGLTASLGFNLLGDEEIESGFDFILKNPPNKIIEKKRTKSNKKITFMKFCPPSSLAIIESQRKSKDHRNVLLTVGGAKKQKSLSLWEFVEGHGLEHYPNYKTSLISEMNTEIPEQIANVSWCSNLPQFIITTASSVYIYCVLVTKQSPNNFVFQIQELFKKRLGQEGLNRSMRVLCAEFNPLTNFVYVGSSIQSIRVYNQSLQAQMLTIQPFFRTRFIKFLFSNSVMLAVSATKPLLILYDLFKMQEIGKLNLQDFSEAQNSEILSIRIEEMENGSEEERYWQKEEVCTIVTEKKIYIVSFRYEDNSENQNFFFLRHVFNNPFANESALSLEVESMIYAGKYLVTLGSEEFHAYELPLNKIYQDKKSENTECKEYRWTCKEAFTFDIANNLLISGDQDLLMWGYQTTHNGISPKKNQSSMQEVEMQEEMYEDIDESPSLEHLGNLGVNSQHQVEIILNPQPHQVLQIDDGLSDSESVSEEQDIQEIDNIELMDSDDEQEDF